MIRSSNTDLAISVAASAGSVKSVRQNLLGMSLTELEDSVVELGLPKFRARQVWRWVWRHGLKIGRAHV